MNLPEQTSSSNSYIVSFQFNGEKFMALLTEWEIEQALTTLHSWNHEQNAIHKTLEFADFSMAMVFVNAVAFRAEEHNHHPDIEIRWNKVTLSLTTHSEGGLTEKDIHLAKEIDSLAVGN
jgi:4a-hydroxytetrahydrobiopterin dehydratase